MTQEEITGLQQELSELSNTEFATKVLSILKVDLLLNGVSQAGLSREDKPHTEYLVDTHQACHILRSSLLPRLLDSDIDYEDSLLLTSIYYDLIKFIRGITKVLSYNSLATELGYDYIFSDIQEASNRVQFYSEQLE